MYEPSSLQTLRSLKWKTFIIKSSILEYAYNSLRFIDYIRSYSTHFLLKKKLERKRTVMNDVIKISIIVRLQMNKHHSNKRKSIITFILCLSACLISSVVILLFLSPVIIEIEFEAIEQSMALSVIDGNSILLHRRTTCRFTRMLVINVGDRTSKKKWLVVTIWIERERKKAWNMFDSLIFRVLPFPTFHFDSHRRIHTIFFF